MFDLIYADAASSVRKVPSPSAMKKITNNFTTVKCLLYFTFLKI